MEMNRLFSDISEEDNWANCDGALDRGFFVGHPNGDGRGDSASVSRSHSQAEKRRRDRINAQLATLRKLIPKSDKMDKAALLGSAVAQLKDLKRKASEVAESAVIPSEVDEVTIDREMGSNLRTEGSNQRGCVRASLSCDDRPELFGELIGVLKSLRLVAVRADVSSIGGRIKSMLVVHSRDGEEDRVCVDSLKQSLKVVLSRIACSSMAAVSDRRRIRSKRQRFFFPPPPHQSS
ncbi:hypothetical protein MLD38_011096 [Melastoma candidum]|uniref:Uncharacterized protein n=1 Tax=Melastoma candidum TaxID=119954 RepID=A0ACB9R1Z6_9MYRT|nr:hypothetical protein MLD38_011096 [Melastoma candidum]